MHPDAEDELMEAVERWKANGMGRDEIVSILELRILALKEEDIAEYGTNDD